ncbi:MAG: serine hydrolase domain-containing protein, partial [Nitrospiraceae bacterium]
QSLYSDLGFILLGLLVERLTGRSLAAFCRERVYDPIGVRSLRFMNGRNDEEPMALVAATEDDPWRGRILQAEVHDENAYALGGVAGHAGLFGTATGVAAITGLWLENCRGKTGFLLPDLVRRFVSRQATPGSSWGLGWDTPSPPSSSGRHFSSRAFGHLGFTGTSIWIDPRCDLEVVLLSNRVHPTRRNTAIQKFRPMIHDVVYEQMGRR